MHRTGREFLESMSGFDGGNAHEDNCGHCATAKAYADAARELLTSVPADISVDDAVRSWSDLSTQLWQQSKFYILWQEETAAGRDPRRAFAERGWEV